MIERIGNLYRKAKGQLLERVKLHGAYKNVFDTPQGEEVLKHIMRVGFITRSTFVAGDPNQTCLNEGQRRLALSILRFVRKDKTKLIEQIEKGLQDED